MSTTYTTGRLYAAAARDTSDAALIQSIGAGDKGAMRVLFARHNVRIYRFLLRFVADKSTAEDLVSEVFLDVWRQAIGFQARTQVATWLLAIARNKALSTLRQRPTEELAHREVIDLIYYHEKSIAEVAEIIRVPQNTVKTRMFYARRQIAELMVAQGIDRANV